MVFKALIGLFSRLLIWGTEFVHSVHHYFLNFVESGVVSFLYFIVFLVWFATGLLFSFNFSKNKLLVFNFNYFCSNFFYNIYLFMMWGICALEHV